MAQKRCQEPIVRSTRRAIRLLVPDTFSELRLLVPEPFSEPPQTLVVGIGSAHGDDQAGWMMAQAVAEESKADHSVSVRLAKNPMDLLGWLDGVDSLHVCDACNVFDTAGAVHQYGWKSGKLLSMNRLTRSGATEPEPVEIMLPFRNRSSHDFGLPQALQLAEITSRMPSQITVWAIEAGNFAPGDSISESTHRGILKAVGELTKMIRSEAKATENCNA